MHRALPKETPGCRYTLGWASFLAKNNVKELYIYIYICTHLNRPQVLKDLYYVLTDHERIVDVSSVKIANFDCVVRHRLGSRSRVVRVSTRGAGNVRRSEEQVMALQPVEVRTKILRQRRPRLGSSSSTREKLRSGFRSSQFFIIHDNARRTTLWGTRSTKVSSPNPDAF